MEKLIKNKLGQWKLVTEVLHKAWVKDEKDSTPHAKMRELYPTAADGLLGPSSNSNSIKHPLREENNRKLSSMFSELADAHSASSTRGAVHHLDRIKNFIKEAPTGSIDIGHLHKLKQKHDPRNPSGPGQLKAANPKVAYDNRFNDGDVLNAANQHIIGAKSLKDVHDMHGIDTVGAIAAAHGVNNDPYMTDSAGNTTTPLHEHKNLKPLIGDVQAFVAGNYGQHKPHDPDIYNHDGMYYSSNYGNGDDHPDSAKHNKKVSDAYHSAFDDQFGSKKFEDAVLDRGLASFKHAHKIK